MRDLEVTLDTELSMQRHVNKVASTSFHQIHRLKQVHRLLGREVTLKCIYIEQTGLLQCSVSRFDTIYDCPTAAGTKRN